VKAFHSLFEFSVDMRRFDVPKRKLIVEMDEIYKRDSHGLSRCSCPWNMFGSCFCLKEPKRKQEPKGDVKELVKFGDLMDKEDSRNSQSMKHLKEEFDASKTWHLLIEDIKNENPVFKFFLSTVEGDLATKCLGLVTLAKPLERNASLKLANW
jgi:hypothetical protein